MRHSIRIPVAWKSIAKYVLAAFLWVQYLFLLPTTTTLLSTIGKAIEALQFMLACCWLIDAQARELLRLIWEEIKGTLKQLTSKRTIIQAKTSSLTSEN